MRVLGTIPVLFSSVVFGNDPPLTEASHLVRAMQVDRGVLVGMQGHFRQGAPKPTEPSWKFYECLMSTKSSVYTSIFTEAFAKEMASEEIRDAINFFEGPIGKKYTQRDIIQLQQSLHISAEESTPNFSDQENAMLEQFLKTETAKKLKRISNSEPVQNALFNKTDDI